MTLYSLLGAILVVLRNRMLRQGNIWLAYRDYYCQHPVQVGRVHRNVALFTCVLLMLIFGWCLRAFQRRQHG